MKKILLSLIAIFTLSSNAQDSDWKLTTVYDHSNNVAGYIYHTSAKVDSILTGLRLVCPSDNYLVNKSSTPVIVVLWDKMIGNIPQSVEIKVNGKQIGVGQETKWNQEGSILYRPISESATRLQALKTGTKVSFQWGGKTAIFDLKTFRTDLNEFNKVCKTSI